MYRTDSLPQKLRLFFLILLPIFITQVALSAMNFADTTMSGHAGRDDLAGVAIGSNIWMPVFTGINGILLAVTPIMAHLHGAGKKEKVPFVVVQGLYLALILAGTTILGGALTVLPLLHLLHLEPAVETIAYQFLKAIAIGIVPFFLSMVLRSFIDTLGYTRVTMLITLTALPINILFNYLLIFGNWGFPRLGGVGAGYASAITYWCIVLITVLVIRTLEPFKEYGLFRTLFRISPAAFKEQLAIGLPIGVSIFCETSIFGVVALLMAKFGTVVIAAHQAAINFAGLVYMLPLSISMALTIAVGFEVGAGRVADARQYSYLGIGIAVSLALICAAGLLLFNGQVAGLYTASPDVLRLIQQFLVYAAFFQLSDAIAAPIQGTLRGYKDVTVAFMMALISYWVVGLPAGFILANYTHYGPFGYWLGFIIGLAFGAIGLSLRLVRIQRKLIWNKPV
ncbi:multi antimicrobial extrusion protein [Lucifera butyrica]|uniref:Probable multidrug resistance protein NorM n=1 Tax=Lucifera butyrica TaxID=1351585 RepID=A0A498RJ83_9FIRM|nr:MATE family efflux transporter [Lucifera butyrica]VBB09078.1 multi antimicrobial extrusion protein [Lucifera butyrica]